MAENSSNDVIFLLELNLIHKALLYQIRHWENLKVAIEGESIWVKNFTNAQIERKELNAIPFITIYESRNNLLFPKGSLLPIKKMLNILWTPIDKALTIELPDLNLGFFSISQKLKIKLVKCFLEQTASILVADIELVNKYIVNASFIRLQKLKWVLINNNEVILFGQPFLPINGKAYWQTGNFILPLGYDFEFPILKNTINKKIGSADYIWWKDEISYSIIPKDAFKPLSIASWKQTLEK